VVRDGRSSCKSISDQLENAKKLRAETFKLVREVMLAFSRLGRLQQTISSLIYMRKADRGQAVPLLSSLLVRCWFYPG
jgi:hypothetical protein